MDGFLTGCDIYRQMLNGLDIVASIAGISSQVNIPTNAKYAMIASIGGLTPPFPVIMSAQHDGSIEVGVETSNGSVYAAVSVTNHRIEINSGRMSVIFFG